MLSIYCKGHKHPTQPGELCEACKLLEQYAHKRLDCCPYGEEKEDCKSCPIHCYKPAMRQQIRGVMKYAGMRMIWYAPIETIKHFLK